MSYSKQEQKNIWKKFDYYCYKSIELGFNGIISPQFFEKLKQVKKVRRHLKIDLIIMITVLITCSYAHIYSFINNIISFICFIITVFMTYGIYKNLKIWMEISKIRTQRFKEHHEKHNK